MKIKYCLENMEIGDEIINVPVGDSSLQLSAVIKVNNEGQEILDLLKNDISEEEIVEHLTSKYSTDEDTIKTRVHEFINKLRSLELIEN